MHARTPESAARPIMTGRSAAWTMKTRASPRARDALSTCGVHQLSATLVPWGPICCQHSDPRGDCA